MRNVIRWAALACAALSLTACLVPEKFDASMRVRPDASYTYSYVGSAVHVVAAEAIKKKGGLDPKDEAGLKREADKAAAMPGVRKMAYQGAGRFDVAIEQDLQPGQQATALKLFFMRRDADGSYVVTGPALKPKDRDGLQSLGIRIDGKAEVFLPAGAKVLDHNAASTPGLLSKSYAWKIGAVADQPSIRFTLPHP